MRLLIILGICIISVLTILNYDLKYEQEVVAGYSDLLPSVRKQVDCLAQNIYYEAGHEPKEGKVAVALVTLHRVHSKQFKNSVCGVVRERTEKVCQFSWWCEDKNRNKALNKTYQGKEQEIYNKALAVALHVYLNYEKIPDVTRGAKYYHADYVNPGWHNLKQTTKIGRHIFYKPKHERELKQNDAETKLSTKREQKSTREFFHDAYGEYLVRIM